jgi:hypothetical protein
VDGARHDGGIEAGTTQSLVARSIPVDVDGRGRPALSDNGRDLSFLFRINENERFTAEAVEILFKHSAG